MCDKCVDIDKKITRFRNLAQSVGDRRTINSIVVMIAELEERKDALHSQREQ